MSRSEFDDVVKRFKREQYEIKIEPSEFKMSSYNQLMGHIGLELDSLRLLRQKCTQVELKAEEKMLRDWEDSKQKSNGVMIPEDETLTKVSIDTISNVWKVHVEKGNVVKKGDVVAILEAMKMEISIHSPVDGKVEAVLKSPGDLAEAGDTLLLLR